MNIPRFTVCTVALMALASCRKSGTEPTTSGVITVVITPSTAAVKPGEQVQLRGTVTGPPGIPTTVYWQSNDIQYATVSSTGLVTGVAEGTAHIRATWTEDPEEFSVAVILVTSTPIVDGQPKVVTRTQPSRKSP